MPKRTVSVKVDGRDHFFSLTEEMLQAAKALLDVRITAKNLFDNWHDIDGDGRIAFGARAQRLGSVAIAANADLTENADPTGEKIVAVCKETQRIVATREKGDYCGAYRANFPSPG